MNLISADDFYCDEKTTCCFTGHRNKDLPFKGDSGKAGMKHLASMLQLKIEEAIHDGYDTFISGMAEGTDLLCAEIVRNLKMRGQYPNIDLVCAIPYKEQKEEFSHPIYIYRYSLLLKRAKNVIILSQKENKDRYKIRNQFMVDHSSKIIGVYKPKPHGSGTLQTINMAKRKGIDMHIIELDKNPVVYIDTDNHCGNQVFKLD